MTLKYFVAKHSDSYKPTSPYSQILHTIRFLEKLVREKKPN
jgi:hypothetical protein